MLRLTLTPIWPLYADVPCRNSWSRTISIRSRAIYLLIYYLYKHVSWDIPTLQYNETVSNWPWNLFWIMKIEIFRTHLYLFFLFSTAAMHTYTSWLKRRLYRWPQKINHYQESLLNRIKNVSQSVISHQWWAPQYYVCIKYSVCDLLRDVITCCVDVAMRAISMCTI